MRKKRLFFIPVILLFVSCAPSLTAQKGVLPQAQISATQKNIPVEELDLSILLPSELSLPDGVILSKSSSTFENRDVIQPLKFFWIQMEDSTSVRGGINIYVYESPLDLKESYAIESTSNNKVADKAGSDAKIGEISQISSYVIGSDQVNDLVFYRCNVLVSIRFISSNTNEIIMIGKSIDGHISTSLCR